MEKEIVYLVLLKISFVVAAAIIGDPGSFMLFVFLLVTAAIIHALFRIRSISKDLFMGILHSVYVLCFASTAALIALVTLPYVIFHNSFVSILFVQYAYLFPVMIIFFMAIYYFSGLIHEDEIRYWVMLKKSFMITSIISVVITVSAIGWMDLSYNQKAGDYAGQFDDAMATMVSAGSAETNEVYREISIYQKESIDEAYRYDYRDSFCFADDCLRIHAHQAFYLIKVIVRAYIIEQSFIAADEELNNLRAGKYLEDFASLESYSDHLKDQVDMLDLTTMPENDKEAMLLLDSNLDYDTVMWLQGKYQDGNIINAETRTLFQVDSPFYNSISHMLTHTQLFRDVARLIIKTYIYTAQEGKNWELTLDLYNNIDIAESDESKIIRYRLILD